MSQYSQNPNPFTPGVGIDPTKFSNETLNPTGSNFSAAPFSKATSELIVRDVFKSIFWTEKEKFGPVNFLYSRPMVSVNSDEFEWFEKPWGRDYVDVNSFNAGTSTVTISGTYASAADLPVVQNDILYGDDGSGKTMIVTSVTHSPVANSSTFVVATNTGGSLPTISAGDHLAFKSPLATDGTDTMYRKKRINLIKRYNFIEMMEQGQHWGLIERIKIKNGGRFDNYMDFEKKHVMNDIKISAISTLFGGNRGEFNYTTSSGTASAKTTNGIYPMMLAAGAPQVTTSLNGLPSVFQALAFATNYQSEGGVRLIFADEEILYELSKLYKDPIQYTPNDMIADLNLMEYRMGSMRFVPMPVSLFREESVFPREWKNRMLVIDAEAINPCILNGLPHINVTNIPGQIDGGDNFRKYTEWSILLQMGVRFVNPLGGFIIDLT